MTYGQWNQTLIDYYFNEAENEAFFMGKCIISQLLGIPVRINTVDPERIKLWKEIKTWKYYTN